MTALEFRKHVKEAKIIAGYIWWNPRSGYWVELSKREALEMIKGQPSDEVVNASWLNGRKSLHIGLLVM